jgi:hypothetical protein
MDFPHDRVDNNSLSDGFQFYKLHFDHICILVVLFLRTDLLFKLKKNIILFSFELFLKTKF